MNDRPKLLEHEKNIYFLPDVETKRHSGARADKKGGRRIYKRDRRSGNRKKPKATPSRQEIIMKRDDHQVKRNATNPNVRKHLRAEKMNKKRLTSRPYDSVVCRNKKTAQHGKKDENPLFFRKA